MAKEAMTLPAGPEAPDKIEREADPLIGQEIGGCLIEELVAVDPISSSYKAVQLSMERPVALRVLAREMTEDEDAVARFIEATRAAGKLAHPNIVQVYDAGKDHGIYFIALEYVEGKTLKEILQALGPGESMDTTQALDVAEQIAAALEHAHASGIVHRRIRLDSILINGQGVAKLADIGFAASLAESGVAQKLVRRGEIGPGGRMLDLQMTAPEELEEIGLRDPRTDIYSLGAIMFIALTGRLPFMAASEEEMIEKVRGGRHVAIEKLNPSLSRPVQKMVSKAMALAPEGRYRSAAELRAGILDARAL